MGKEPDEDLRLNDANKRAIRKILDDAGQGYTYVSIEDAIRKHFDLGDGADVFDEIHEAISELHSDYERIGIAHVGV